MVAKSGNQVVCDPDGVVQRAGVVRSMVCDPDGVVR